MALIRTTSNVAFKMSLLFFEKKAIKEINKTAAEERNNPRNGIVSACKIPPKADSLKAQSAVIFRTLRFSDLISETN